MGFAPGGTKKKQDAHIVECYRQYIRMPLPKSAAALLRAHPTLLLDIDPASVIRDAEKGIK